MKEFDVGLGDSITVTKWYKRVDDFYVPIDDPNSWTYGGISRSPLSSSPIFKRLEKKPKRKEYWTVPELGVQTSEAVGTSWPEIWTALDRHTAQKVEDVTARLHGRNRRVLTHHYRCRDCLANWWQQWSISPRCEKCRSYRVKRLNYGDPVVSKAWADEETAEASSPSLSGRKRSGYT